MERGNPPFLPFPFPKALLFGGGWRVGEGCKESREVVSSLEEEK